MEFCTFHQDLVWLSCFGSPDFGTAVSLHVSSKGLNLCFVFCSLILLALRPPFLSLSGTSRHGFVHPTLVPFPDFIPQRFDALAHEFDLAACSHLSSIFHRSFLPANSSSLTNSLFYLLWKFPEHRIMITIKILVFSAIDLEGKFENQDFNQYFFHAKS